MLTHCGPPLTELLPQWCGVFARIFSPTHVQEVVFLCIDLNEIKCNFL